MYYVQRAKLCTGGCEAKVRRSGKKRFRVLRHLPGNTSYREIYRDTGCIAINFKPRCGPAHIVHCRRHLRPRLVVPFAFSGCRREHNSPPSEIIRVCLCFLQCLGRGCCRAHDEAVEHGQPMDYDDAPPAVVAQGGEDADVVLLQAGGELFWVIQFEAESQKLLVHR